MNQELLFGVANHETTVVVVDAAYTKPFTTNLPEFNDTATATAFIAQLKSSSKVKVLIEIDEGLFFTMGIGLINCSNPNSPRCQGPDRTRFAASINNVSFVFPRRTSLMQAYYQDFPPLPPIQFDYTGNVSRCL
ncbi:hypothetical protein CRYUN_Cryun12cG0137800 [Craigia yunnanensis]